MLIRSRECIVVEVIDGDRGTIDREMEIELQQQRADSAGGCGLAGQGEEDVAVLVQEFKDVLGGKGGSIAWSRGQLRCTKQIIWTFVSVALTL
jgi:hypothetical protein